MSTVDSPQQQSSADENRSTYTEGIIISGKSERINIDQIKLILQVQLTISNIFIEVAVEGNTLEVCRRFNLFPIRGTVVLNYLFNKACMVECKNGNYRFVQLT